MRNRRNNGDLSPLSALALLHHALVASLSPQPQSPGQARCGVRAESQEGRPVCCVLSPAPQPQCSAGQALQTLMVSKEMPRPLALSPVVLEPQHVLPPTGLLNSSLARPPHTHSSVFLPLSTQKTPTWQSLAVPCTGQLIAKCSYTLSLPRELS